MFSRSKLIFFVLITICCAFSIYAFSHQLDLTNSAQVKLYLEQNQGTGFISLFILSLVFVSFGGPKQVIAALCSYLFGFEIGLISSLMICLTSSVISYILGFYLISETHKSKLTSKFNQIKVIQNTSPFAQVLFLRLFPLGSNLLTNLFAACTKVPFIVFISATTIGYLPQMISFSMIGEGLTRPHESTLKVAIVFSLLITLGLQFLYQKLKKHA